MKTGFLLAILLVPALYTTARAADETVAVQAQVSGFYRWYVHELEHGRKAEPWEEAGVHRYVSERLLRAVRRRAKSPDGLDADPFLCAQDWSPEWEKNIRIKDMDPEDARWRVEVELSGKQLESHRIAVTLVRQDGAWKIDKVSDVDTH